jgi:hypothetical protein
MPIPIWALAAVARRVKDTQQAQNARAFIILITFPQFLERIYMQLGWRHCNPIRHTRKDATAKTIPQFNSR